MPAHCSLDQKIAISPSVWPGEKLAVQPGDFGVLLPYGFGISGLPVIRPWDDPFHVGAADYHGFQPRTGDPFRDAPLTSAAGGELDFDGVYDKQALPTLCRLLKLDAGRQDYAAFLVESDDPVRDRWLVQSRLVSRFALRHLFGALGPNEFEQFPRQNPTLLEAIAAFVDDQEQHWLKTSPSDLSGTAGGDGDWAKEELGFGIMVENDDHEVVRVWSRAWLITK